MTRGFVLSPTLARPRVGAFWLVLALTCALAAAMPAALAQGAVAPTAAEQGPAWSSLSAAERSNLQPLAAEWSGIDASRKQKWLEVAARLPAMSPPEQKRVQVRMAEWARLSPAERGRARLQFQESRQLPSDDRQARWQAYQSLPNDQRQALAAKAAPAPAKAGRPQAPPAAAARSDAKRNEVALPPPAAPLRPIAPTVVQSRPGATTSLVNKSATPPLHHQAGLPKIAATKGFVDPATLLPKRGPQGAAVAASPGKDQPARARP